MLLVVKWKKGVILREKKKSNQNKCSSDGRTSESSIYHSLNMMWIQHLDAIHTAQSGIPVEGKSTKPSYQQAIRLDILVACVRSPRVNLKTVQSFRK